MTRNEQAKEIYNTLFGDLPDASSETDHELMEILRNFIFGDVFHTGSLDIKTREIITVTCLATMQTLPQLKAHLNSSLRIGIEPITLREIIYNLAPFIGFPKTLNAISVLNEVLTENDIQLPLENCSQTDDMNRYTDGLAVQYPIYGNEIKDKYTDYPEIPQFLTEFGFGDFCTRKGLDEKTREMVTFVALVVLKSDVQIKAHALGNIKIGNDKRFLYEVLLQCLPYIGFPYTLNALNILKNEI